MTDARVAGIRADASAHAHDAGTSLADEFGTPRAYAQRFATDQAVARRRTAWLSTAVALLALVHTLVGVLEGTAHLWGLAWLLVGTTVAALEWRAVRSAGRDARDGTR